MVYLCLYLFSLGSVSWEWAGVDGAVSCLVHLLQANIGHPTVARYISSRAIWSWWVHLVIMFYVREALPACWPSSFLFPSSFVPLSFLFRSLLFFHVFESVSVLGEIVKRLMKNRVDDAATEGPNQIIHVTKSSHTFSPLICGPCRIKYKQSQCLWRLVGYSFL